MYKDYAKRAFLRQDKEMKFAKFMFWFLMVGGALVLLSEAFITPNL